MPLQRTACSSVAFRARSDSAGWWPPRPSTTHGSSLQAPQIRLDKVVPDEAIQVVGGATSSKHRGSSRSRWEVWLAGRACGTSRTRRYRRRSPRRCRRPLRVSLLIASPRLLMHEQGPGTWGSSQGAPPMQTRARRGLRAPGRSRRPCLTSVGGAYQRQPQSPLPSAGVANQPAHQQPVSHRHQSRWSVVAPRASQLWPSDSRLGAQRLGWGTSCKCTCCIPRSPSQRACVHRVVAFSPRYKGTQPLLPEQRR